MRPFFDWLVAAFVLAGSTAYVLRFADAALPVPASLPSEPVPRRGEWSLAVIPIASSDPAPPLTLPSETWCEPPTLQPCETSADCPTAPDGVPFACVSWVAEDGSLACAAQYPPKAVRHWRAERLRVLVDEICKPRDGCNPRQLHAYLSALILRESSWRPWKVHRLSGDVEANALAWSRYADLYRDNPAAGDPVRWSVGRGYFGGNAAGILHVWDATAIPEALCGEVEAVLVHLRTARKMWRRLNAGVECSGAEHHGTADGEPGWYDVSLANSGSDPCPGTSGRRLAVRQGFERRAKSQGLDPYGRVTLRMLGRPIPRDEQAAFASRLRRKMDAVPQP